MTDRIQLLDDLGAEFARVSAEAERTRRRRRPIRAGGRARTLSIALAMTAALGGTAYAIPTTRTALDAITGPLAAWVSGGDDRAPGRALRPGDNAPAWLSDSPREEARLIAEAEGVGLFVGKIEVNGEIGIGFSLGQGFGMADSLEGWRERLDRHTVFVLGYSIFGGKRRILDDRGRMPLFGVTTRDVERIKLRYAEGLPLVSDNGDGGFVLLVDAWRRMREIVAFDAKGHVLGRADVSRRNLTHYCEREPGCPPASRRPIR